MAASILLLSFGSAPILQWHSCYFSKTEKSNISTFFKNIDAINPVREKIIEAVLTSKKMEQAISFLYESHRFYLTPMCHQSVVFNTVTCIFHIVSLFIAQIWDVKLTKPYSDQWEHWMMKLTLYTVLFYTISVQNDDQENLLCDPQSHSNISETLCPCG